MENEREELSRPPLGEDDLEALFGPRVRQLRKARGWSQEDLGRRLAGWGWPMHQTTVAKLESGSRPIRLNELAALALIFGMSVEELIPPASKLQDELEAGDAGRRVRDLQVAAQVATHRATAARERLLHATAEAAGCDRDLEEARVALDEATQTLEAIRRG